MAPDPGARIFIYRFIQSAAFGFSDLYRQPQHLEKKKKRVFFTCFSDVI